ncbi:RNA methyltransferase, TrmH family, group 3 [Winkia neuii]|uniref:23S rRNA (guanosine(2251)-2'-O)-methyltransferase RlmB n=1 Tax=Winkia neuii TaxID=33007 RepID=UPI000763E75F|nr:23S rRNA (guanosine(2251)-2'-O)-methyltransferase RlmB [Winkia neuii]KWZ74287.1 RNA methyltransferase, TrmH family, group 3 [Winkia neuii]
MSQYDGRPAGSKRRVAKKGPTKGSGGKNRRALAGKGPTPKAENRPYHAAYKRKQYREVREKAAQAQAAAKARKAVIKVPEGHELVFGRNSVAEAVAAGIKITRMFVAGGAAKDDRMGQAFRVANAAGAPILQVEREDLDYATDGAVHQGVAIEVPEYEYSKLSDLFEKANQAGGPGLLIALDHVTDPHNLGAVLRSAGAFGANGVLVPTRNSASVNATVWKVSAGALARVPVAREANLVHALKECKKHGYFVVGLDAGGTETTRDLTVADQPLVLVTGSEGAGLSRLVRQTCDVIASIPISAAVESLNAAVATGIAIYDIAQVRAQAKAEAK